MPSRLRLAPVLLVALVPLLLATPRLPAQVYWEPPEGMPFSEPIRAIRYLPLRQLGLGSLVITLEETTLDSVQQRYPRSLIGQSGDAGSFRTWLCLFSGSPTLPWVLWLQSDEMGAGNRIMGFTLERVPATARADPRCASLAPSGTTLRLPLRLHLAATRLDVVRQFGRPSRERGDTLLYLYLRRIPGDPADPTEYAQVANWVCVLLKNGRVIKIEAWKSTTF